MRKALLAVALILGLAPGGTTASNAAPVSLQRMAGGLWSVGEMKDGTQRMIGAFIWITEDPEGSRSEHFGVFKGYCPEPVAPDNCLISSDGSIFGEAKPGEVEIDPALGSAYLEVTRRGRTHVIDWTSDSSIQPDASETTCGDEASGLMGWGERPAIAAGSALGKKLKADATVHVAFVSLRTEFCGPAEAFLESVERYLGGSPGL